MDRTCRCDCTTECWCDLRSRNRCRSSGQSGSPTYCPKCKQLKRSQIRPCHGHGRHKQTDPAAGLRGAYSLAAGLRAAPRCRPIRGEAARIARKRGPVCFPGFALSELHGIVMLVACSNCGRCPPSNGPDWPKRLRRACFYFAPAVTLWAVREHCASEKGRSLARANVRPCQSQRGVRSA